MDWGNCLSKEGIPTLQCIPTLISGAINIALGLAGTVAVLLIIAAGIKYITSGGGKAVDEAKNMLTYAIIGLIVVLSAFFIVRLIGGFTGITCFFSFGFGTCQ